ncbi:hypothetical protein Droror1_Dr00028339 [Drosera rotundifolia]
MGPTHHVPPARSGDPCPDTVELAATLLPPQSGPVERAAVLSPFLATQHLASRSPRHLQPLGSSSLGGPAAERASGLAPWPRVVQAPIPAYPPESWLGRGSHVPAPS